MIIGFFGDPRGGKTCSAVAEVVTILEREPDRVVYSNIHLSIPYTPLNLDMILDAVEGRYTFADDCVLLIDEIYLFGLDSRSSSSKVNKSVSWFLMQSAKMGKTRDIGLILVFTAQYPVLVDKRLWAVCSIKIACSSLRGPSHYIVQQVIEQRLAGPTCYRRMLYAPPFYSLYNTRERVMQGKTERYDKTPPKDAVSAHRAHKTQQIRSVPHSGANERLPSAAKQAAWRSVSHLRRLRPQKGKKFK